ncbi:type II toxin-antitoxin system VapC family toxin [Methermicoccus shengliensis]|uniref:type II toxin-antitoxin system VapC family toxin n=1 Tax=Methermicoccus shengliensis TaxID=660064 RepID=UPI0012F6CBC2|nr:type II toxin-antitoxin system VapC family toxin [Methermicoccus shengliensis]
MPVMDTSFLVGLVRKEAAAMELLDDMIGAGFSLSTTEISILELYRGAHLSSKPKENLDYINKTIEPFNIINVSRDVYDVFGKLSAKLKKEGRPMGEFDGLIAALALCYDGMIISGDEHFKHSLRCTHERGILSPNP